MMPRDFDNAPKESIEEIFAELDGQTLEEARAEQALRKKLSPIAERCRGKSSDQWPIRGMRWDVSRAGQRWSLDGISAEEFETEFSGGFILGWASLSDIEKHLHFSSKRSREELWTLGSPGKLANLIAHLANGGAVSPPLIAVWSEDSREDSIILRGGHHRFAAAQALDTKEIPIYVSDEAQRHRLDQLFTVNWHEGAN